MAGRDIPSHLSIKMFMHCGLCLKSRPEDESPQNWARLEVGWTELGLQVWCKRHDCNVVHIDFEGQKHPASIARLKTEDERQLPLH